MAISKPAVKKVLKKSDSGTKRAKQGAVRHEGNVSLSTRLKTQEKKVLKVVGGEVEQVKKTFEALVSMLDKAVKKGVIHKNKAARKKSLFQQRVLADKPAVKAPVRPKAAKGTSAKDKSKAKAKVKAKAKK